jgi:hypothetical protein
MVMPRNTSSETMRPARAVFAAAVTLEAGPAIVSAVAMRSPSAGADTTAAWRMPQRRDVKAKNLLSRRPANVAAKQLAEKMG